MMDMQYTYIPTQGRENNREATENGVQFSPETPREINSDTISADEDLCPLSYKSMHLQQDTHTDSYKDRSDVTSRPEHWEHRCSTDEF